MSDDSHEYDEDALEFIEDERVRIAALHATCPKQIWLQVDPEAEQFDGWDAQTWCSDKINETDVRYVLATSRDAEVAELKAEIARLDNGWRFANESKLCSDLEIDQLRKDVKMLHSYLKRWAFTTTDDECAHMEVQEALAATEPE